MTQSPRVVLVTTTFYGSAEDLRFKLALKTCEEAARCGYPIIIVDGSPEESIRDLLRDTGATVLEQLEGGMGASRRQVLRAALETDADVFVWLEPEKHPLVSLLEPCIDMVDAGSDLVIPTRMSLESLPSYQELSELRGNHALAQITGRGLDLFFGPRVMNRPMAQLMLSYKGERGDTWHILFLPVLWALHSGWKVSQKAVDYVHPPEQTKAEEGDKVMDGKRGVQRLSLVTAMQEEAARLNYI